MQELTNRINLNRWTTQVALISPFLLIVLLYQIPVFNNLSHGLKFSIQTILEVFTVTILYGLQFYLGISFFEAIDKKALFYKTNGTLAFLFCILACGFTLYHLPDYLKMRPTKQRETEPTPIFDTFVYVMLIHLALTYFLVNNQVVRYYFKKITDNERQVQLKLQFLNPMNKIVKTSALLIIGLFIYGMIYFMLHPKVK